VVRYCPLSDAGSCLKVAQEPQAVTRAPMPSIYMLERGDAVADGGVRGFGLVYGDHHDEEADTWVWLVW